MHCIDKREAFLMADLQQPKTYTCYDSDGTKVLSKTATSASSEFSAEIILERCDELKNYISDNQDKVKSKIEDVMGNLSNNLQGIPDVNFNDISDKILGKITDCISTANGEIDNYKANVIDTYNTLQAQMNESLYYELKASYARVE
jgi:phage-related tail protein